MADGQWWYDLKTHQVVPDNNDTKITDRRRPNAHSSWWRSATRRTTTTRAGTTISDRSITRCEYPTLRGMPTLYTACMPCTASRSHAAWDAESARPPRLGESRLRYGVRS
jgi:hypothetical protein